jgi:hypothetical protein
MQLLCSEIEMQTILVHQSCLAMVHGRLLLGSRIPVDGYCMAVAGGRRRDSAVTAGMY